MRRTVGAALLGVVLVLPRPAAAQASPEGSRDGATARFAAAGKLTSLQGNRTLMAGGSAVLRLTSRLSFGGAGWVLAQNREIESATPGPELLLRMAYGGARFELDVGSVGRLDIGLGVTVGAGNAKAELRAVGTEVSADNFLVVEPEATVRIPLGRHLALFGSGGYRMVGAVEDLPGVSAESLRGSSGSLGIVAHLF